jgi:hypothetical protein
MVREAAKQFGKRGIIVAIQLPIAGLHFVTGSRYAGPFPVFVNGYLLDILLPLGFYFLLCMPNIRPTVLHRWYARCILVFTAATGAELAQYHGIDLFGSTFDPLDIVMYGTGVIIAAILDTRVFPGIFPTLWPHTMGE